MDKSKILLRIGEIYNKGENIIQYLKKLNDKNEVTTEDILISYDFQAGKYIERTNSSKSSKNIYAANIAKVIDELGEINSIMEAGVGEATTLGRVIKNLKTVPEHIFGFDLSWSRIKYGQKFLKSYELQIQNSIHLCTGDLFNSPFPDNAFDLVYTSHTLEPNGGLEKEALEALYRITNKYLVLLEPAYELGSNAARERMDKHKYVTNLRQTALDLGYKIMKYELFEPCSNPLNPTSIMIIKKEAKNYNHPSFVCPITKTILREKDQALFSKDSLLAYPVLAGVPCLLPSNGIVATHFLDDFS